MYYELLKQTQLAVSLACLINVILLQKFSRNIGLRVGVLIPHMFCEGCFGHLCASNILSLTAIGMWQGGMIHYLAIEALSCLVLGYSYRSETVLSKYMWYQGLNPEPNISWKFLKKCEVY